jgi:hypothetical protein
LLDTTQAHIYNYTQSKYQALVTYTQKPKTPSFPLISAEKPVQTLTINDLNVQQQLVENRHTNLVICFWCRVILSNGNTRLKNGNQMTGVAIFKGKSHSANHCDFLASHSPDRQIREAAEKQ